MSKFDMFTRALALGNFRQAFSVFVVEELSPGQFCHGHKCSTGNQNCPVGCFCNTQQNKCVGSK